MDATATPPNKRPSAEQVAAGRREVARRWRRKRRVDEPKQFKRATLRVRDLQALIRHRYGMAMPDDDAGREDLEVLVGYLVLAGKDPWHQLELLAPWCTEAAAARMIEVAQRFSDWHDDDQLAHLLRLRYETRLHLGITSIGAIDVDRAGRAPLRRQRWNAKRRAQPEPKDLSCRQQAVLDEIGGDEVAVPALVERLKRNRAFRGIAAPSLRIIVHRVLDQLIAIGLIGDYYAPGQKGPVRNVQRVSNDRARRAEA